MTKSGIKVQGHRGTWYVLKETFHRSAQVYLVESEQWGDEAAALIIDGNGDVIFDEVYDGVLDERIIH